MKSRIKRYLLVGLLVITVFGSQIACDDETETVRKNVGTVGCANPTARDACGNNTHCRIEACN